MNAVIALTDLLLQERSSLNHEQTEHLEVIQTSGHHLLTVRERGGREKGEGKGMEWILITLA